jgi:LacI family transcriptional regulator
MADGNENRALTSRDIADICGVSQSTVSRVLSGHPNVSVKTREAVTRVLNETGFVPNATARAMRTHRTRTVGVVVHAAVNKFGFEAMSHVHKHVVPHGLQLSVWLAGEDGNAPDALQALRERLVDGLVYTTAVDGMPELEAMIDAGAPIVLMGRTLRGAGTDTVAGADSQGGALVADYAFLNGRDKIAVIGGGRAFSPGREIEDGFRRRLESLGAPVDDRRATHGDSVHASGDAALEELWRGGEEPDVIFCVDDLLAHGVLDAARAKGIRVPEDLWVIGYNDIPMSAWAAYSLTTVRQPLAQMAELSVRLLMKKIAGGPTAPSQRLWLEGTLIIRGSTAHAPASGELASFPRDLAS